MDNINETQENTTDETGGVYFSSMIKITDNTTNETVIIIRGDE